ncbi:leucyl/phenylalanyl-tRNA--protein transferase [Arsenicicoccus sp. oral taxon 190]|uniref:leucyl/phenylalanyl-tRNA--protein transferase n=1 Tax=Arsenicicoccus sp. oral taxon 190 TaxID=1658671 RepID=UPI00067A1C08|nr:leucyl/phenylalanyl-tRNA--protein transferase [Arsenicicoccus sp. oral taxon 190]AKT52065.1 leucyl-tRNA--protein transferase [Arsenicicoccus sp. oral taxon 190]
MTPVEPAPSRWALDLGGATPGEDLVGVGADLTPGTVLQAYRRGLFPMGLGTAGGPPLGWWSPDPRGVLELDGLRVSRSLRRARRGFEVRVDTAFAEVVAACADPRREGAWITPGITRAYADLHRLGWAHSVETWLDGRLVGGLYGIAVGGLFAGESMFHHVTDASKVALVALVELLAADLPQVRADGGDRLVDVQWRTDHLATLGVSEVSRDTYTARLPRLLHTPLPDVWR